MAFFIHQTVLIVQENTMIIKKNELRPIKSPINNLIE